MKHLIALLVFCGAVAGAGCDDGDSPDWGEPDTDSDTDADSDTDTDTDTDTDSDADADSDSDADTDSDADDPAEACHPTAQGWPDAWAGWAEDVLVYTNQARAATTNCGSEGTFPPAPPLVMNPYLRCAARVHSYDMAVEGYFDHDSPGGPIGDDMAERIETAGYTGWSALGENIAWGYSSPWDVVQGWLDSDGHCANIMSASFEDIGVGYAGSGDLLWTQDFGAQL